MRKIIAAFEAPHFSEGVMHFINKMNDAEPVTVTGVFLPAPIHLQFWSYADTMASGILLPLPEGVNPTELNKSVNRFKQYCINHHLRHRVIKNFSDFALPELKQQSRFADLIVLGSEHFFAIPHSDKLSDYLKTSLHEAECPVIVVPEIFSEPKNNILAFDGTESSARAIKNFVYLLPEMAQNHTVTVTFGPKDTNEKEQHLKMKELISVHFPDNKFIHAGTDSNKYFSDWTKEHKSAIIVCGAFGRSLLSELFKHSFIADVLQNKKLPVFISHR